MLNQKNKEFLDKIEEAENKIRKDPELTVKNITFPTAKAIFKVAEKLNLRDDDQFYFFVTVMLRDIISTIAGSIIAGAVGEKNVKKEMVRETTTLLTKALLELDNIVDSDTPQIEIKE